jgi:hypothetical protein
MADLLPRPRYGITKLLVGIAVAALASATLSQGPGMRVAAASSLSIHVQGNELVDSAGSVVTLHGVNRSGTEYMCVQNGNIFDGPSDAASVAAMASWGINAVRVLLNEDCWLGINGASPGGAAYQSAIENYVSLLNSFGLYVILDLNWSAPGTTLASRAEPMPDQDHSPAFWTSVATAFMGNPAVIFDLFGEPYPNSNQDTTAAWQCLLNGGTCPGVSYTAAGMQELLNDVRATGATNVVMSPGVQYTNTLDNWLQYEPSDPLHQLAASFHGYNFNICITVSCWTSELAPVAAQVPLISGEIGEDDPAATYIDAYMAWADPLDVSYLAWTWDTWGCNSGPVLISNYSGTACSGFGAGYEAHLASLPSSPPPNLPPGGGYTLDAYGGVHNLGDSPPVSTTGYWPGWQIAKAIQMDPCDSAGQYSGWVMDAFGGLHPFAAAGTPMPAVPYTTGYWPGWTIANDFVAFCITVNNVQHAAGCVLDGFGGLHAWADSQTVIGDVSCNGTGYWPGWDIATKIAVVPGQDYGYVMDGFGGLHPFNGAPAVNPSGYWPGWTIARGIVATANGGYTVDGFGGIHPFGNAPPVTPSGYWPNWDIVRGIAVASGGTGVDTLDGFGEVHPAGGAPFLWVSHYFPNSDVVVGLVTAP